MKTNVRKFFDLQRLRTYKRPAPLVLVNGLAEQSESWFANRTFWSRHFDVKVPEILVYDGDALHRHIDGGRRGHRRLPDRPAGRTTSTSSSSARPTTWSARASAGRSS